MKIFRVGIIVLTTLLAFTVQGQDIISVGDLVKIYKSDHVVVVWSGASEGYSRHIKGAVNLPHILFYNSHPVKNKLKPAEEMAKIIGEHGITADKTIVVYDEGSGRSSGRMYWLLKYLGAPDVKMLDGNLAAWKTEKNPLSRKPVNRKPVYFTATPDTSLLAKMNEVSRIIGNDSVVLIDARSPNEFAGIAETRLRKGHIPGAVNFDFVQVTDKQGKLKPKEELELLFTSRGITPDKTTIIYCESGARAGILFLALKGLEFPNVKVYDGAYIEWQNYSTNRVE